eukprot:3938208-Rhodomonas_salina.2
MCSRAHACAHAHAHSRTHLNSLSVTVSRFSPSLPLSLPSLSPPSLSLPPLLSLHLPSLSPSLPCSSPRRRTGPCGGSRRQRASPPPLTSTAHVAITWSLSETRLPPVSYTHLRAHETEADL